MNLRRLVGGGLTYIGEVTGVRQTYYVFQGTRRYWILSFSVAKGGVVPAGNFNIIDADAVDYVRRQFAGEQALTSKSLLKRAHKPQYMSVSLHALNILYALVATKKAKIDQRYKTRELHFNIKPM